MFKAEAHYKKMFPTIERKYKCFYCTVQTLTAQDRRQKLDVTPCLISLWLKNHSIANNVYERMPLFFYLKETHFFVIFCKKGVSLFSRRGRELSGPKGNMLIYKGWTH